MKPTIKNVLTKENKSLVNAYLMARAFSETMTEKVEEIQKEILEECPIFENTYGRSAKIVNFDKLYMHEGDVTDLYNESDIRTRAAGLKPADMEKDYCPALVAKSLLSDIENKLIEASGRPFKVTNNGLLCSGNGKGLENRQKWIDLIVKMVVNAPGFKNPMKG